MDPIYKPPSSLDVTKLPPRKPSPQGGMDTNVPTTSGQSPCNPQYKIYRVNQMTLTFKTLRYYELSNISFINVNDFEFWT